ncbi:helix-turn-helix domain-containing protein, partial [Escherichia coli]|uniref:helix-turn-helix domain-containing protein n=1 Tax=Escherichia coli TaxID=562 RepID=UPI0039DFBA10
RLPSTQKLVLIMLAERHNSDSGRCDPSHERLADDCGLTRRSVMDQIKKLEDSGYIRPMSRAKGNLKLSNHYVLNFGFGVPEKVKP